MNKENCNLNIDYRRNSEDGTFKSAIVQNKYRDAQLANQMHKHTHSCFKYCNPGWGCIQCRHNYPYSNDGTTRVDVPVIICGHDRKKRRRVNVCPQRNNAWLNPTLFDPLLTLAHVGNHDCQYVSNTTGAAEYTGSYIGKQEKTDFKLVLNLIFKSLNAKRANNSDLHRLKCVGNAILDSTPVGSVEAMYVLLGLQFVKKSRSIENVNPLHNRFMTKSVELDINKLNAMDTEDEPVKKGLGSHYGKRRAYESLSKYMWETYGECHITLYTMLSNYTCTPVRNTNLIVPGKKSIPPPCLIKLDKSGTIMDDNVILGTSNQKFLVNGVIYIRRKKQAVVNMCPYIATNLTDATSCYSTLLLHVPWPREGEDFIIKDPSQAVSVLENLRKKDDGLPEYVRPFLERLEKSERLFSTTNHENRHDNDDGSECNDDDESVIMANYDREDSMVLDFDELDSTNVSIY